jgi:hypothetical protein
MDFGDSAKLYSRIRGWVMLAMLAGVVIYTFFSVAHDVIWPQTPAAAPATQPASGAAR